MSNDVTTNDGEIAWCEDDLDGLRAAMGSVLRSIGRLKTATLNIHRLSDGVLAPAREAYFATANESSPLTSIVDPHTSIANILSELLSCGEQFGITRIRFYRYSEENDDGSYVLVDSAGYDDDTAARLRIGGLVRFRSASSLRTTDSFWCQHLGVPVLITVDINAPSFLEPQVYPDCFPIICSPVDHCEGLLGKGESTQWWDIPLTVCGESTGKLSCDYQPVGSLREGYERVVRFWSLAQQAAPYLESLYRRQFVLPLHEIVGELQRCGSVEELFEYSTSALPRMFSCLNASVFSLSRDSFAIEKLVLEKSSFSGAMDYEGLVCYSLDDDALTSWVARNNQSMRLHNMEDDRERERQLKGFRAFDGKLNWRNRLRDSHNHTSYLAVPIPADVNQVAGVIRFTEKDAHGVRYFTERDQACLERIAREAIGPRLLALRKAETTNAIAFDNIQATNSLMVSSPVPTSH